jgi:hypothetical protein
MAARRTSLLAAVALSAIVGVAGTGIGATTATVAPSATVLGTLSLAEPTSKESDPPLCTNALAPLDTDDCTDVTFGGSSPRVLNLGALSGTDVQAASLRWRVSTTNPTGYRVVMSNPGSAPLLRTTGGASIADMPTSPLVPAASVPGATAFGVALGDPATDSEGAVPPAWASAGQQGELFSGIPAAGMVVAERGGAATSDPFTATFAAAAIASSPPSAGAYAGTVRVTATAL